MVMVKAFAYGSGGAEVAGLLQFLKPIIWVLHIQMKVWNSEKQGLLSWLWY